MFKKIVTMVMFCMVLPVIAINYSHGVIMRAQSDLKDAQRKVEGLNGMLFVAQADKDQMTEMSLKSMLQKAQEEEQQAREKLKELCAKAKL